MPGERNPAAVYAGNAKDMAFRVTDSPDGQCRPVKKNEIYDCTMIVPFMDG
jgi:hypothetical protein